MGDTTQLYNNGYPFEITPATPDESSLTNSFGSLMADPSGTPPSTSGTFLGGTAKDWAGGLKELGGATSKAGGGIPSAGQRQALPNSAQAHAAFGQAGTLGQLLQILAQRANMFQQAAHQGAVPTPYRQGGGLLGL